MPILSEDSLLARDATRDLNAELLESIEQLKQGQAEYERIERENSLFVDNQTFLKSITLTW